MKIKQHLFITNPAEFLKGDYSDCFNLFGDSLGGTGWIHAGEIEIEVDIDKRECINRTLEALNEKERSIKAEAQKKLAFIEMAKKELTCIEHQETT